MKYNLNQLLPRNLHAALNGFCEDNGYDKGYFLQAAINDYLSNVNHHNRNKTRVAEEYFPPVKMDHTRNTDIISSVHY